MRMRMVITFLVVVALIGAGFGLLVSTPSGQRWITERIVRAVGGTDQTVTVKEVGGEWPSHILWTGVTVADRDGVWLTLDRLDLQLNPGALLAGRLDIGSAVVGRAHMLRQPVGNPAAPASPPPTIDSVARSLSRITVRDARIDVLRLEPAVIGRALDARLTGSLQEDPDSRLQTLALDGRLRAEPGALAVKLAAGRNAAVLQINGMAENLRAAGAITVNNRTNALSGALKLECRGETACYAGPETKLGAIAAELALAGTLAAPQGTLNFSAQDVGYGARRLLRFQGVVAARPREGGVTISGSGVAAGFPDALPELRSVAGDEATWSVALTRLADGALTLDSARIDSGDIVAQIAALGLAAQRTPATLRLSLVGGGRLLGVDDRSSRTEATLRIDRLADGGGAGHLTLAASALPASAEVRPLVQGQLTLDADVVLGADRADFTNIVARSGATVLRGFSGWTRAPRFDHAASSLTLTLAPWAVLPEPTQADVTLKGPLATLHAEVQATAPAVLLSRAPVYDAVLSASVDRTPAGFVAELDGNGRWIDGAVAFSTTAAQTKQGIELGAISWKSPTTAIGGALTIHTAGLVSGALTGPISNLAPLTAAFGAPSEGTGDLTATFVAGQQQRLEASLTARNVANAALTAGALTFSGRFDDLFGAVKLATRAEAAEAQLFGRPLAAFTTRAEGDLKALKVELDAKGAADIPFAVSSATDISFGDNTVVTFKRLVFQDGELQAELLAPTQLTYSAAELKLGDTRIRTRGGEVQGSFTWNRTNDRFDGAVRARNVALPSFADIPGQSTSIVVSGDAELSGPMSSVNATARLTGLLPSAKDQPAITVESAITLAGGRAKIDATAAGLSAEPARLYADIPARLNLAAGRFAVSTFEPVSGSLKWTGSLTPLWRLIPADVNVLAGDVAVDASLSGTLDAPVVSGTFNLARGTYENLVGGTALRNIEARIGADGQGGFTLSLKAQDMNDGTVALSGRISGDADMNADVSVDLARLDVLHRDDVVAAATGRITYAGPLAAGVFKGNVQVVRSLVRLGGSYMPEIPLLRALPGFEPAGNDGLLSAMRVEIAVAIADPMRIEGEGLDSMWRGELTVAGTIARPDVRGTLTLDRGNFSFLSQTFALDNGTVTFTGGGTVDPQLYIVATREASDITATVTITGRARAPEIQLSSRPALPRDEILARLLFRKGTGELGPIESIQLASAASDLAGLSQGGINGVLRRTFGLDLSSGAEGNSVMLGRQFGRNLYVSVGQSLTEQEREIVVEWRFSRSISLKSTTSDVSGADIGVFWRKDY
ncbi:MAG: translocation/assembly module TamB domain-containing protein [Rhodospirillaceae bacterium]